ncbi:MAG: HAD family hydrolase [Erysipelotrichaceae bacterium]|nr:HAD family hydrolase [Erysipelotrichaceae bacterium]
MTIKGLILDLDGTTVSTLEDIQDSINQTLKQNGFPERSYEDVRMAVGNGSLNLIRKTAPEGLDEERIQELLKQYIVIYSNGYNIKSRAYDGVYDLLHELQEKGILLAVNSNKPDHLTKALITECFPGITFVEVMGDHKDRPKKPDPTGANQLAEIMRLNKEEILYVGDSETDIATAKNAGMKSIGCLWGFRDRETLTEAGADYIVSEPAEILKYLGE